MAGILIRAAGGEYAAELDDSDIANAVWLSLPLRVRINMLGGQIYFELPVEARIPAERETVLETGDIAYWPGAGALCIFCGPTPLSGDDRRPVSRYPVVRIGRIEGDCSGLERAGDRRSIIIERRI
jgi:hypothetical protein